MSQLGAIGSDISGLLGDQGKYSGVNVVKSKPIQNQINQLVSDYQSQVGQDSTSLDKYITDYLAQTPQAQQYTSQEENAIGQFYNGDMASQLANLRAQQLQAGNTAVNQALQFQRGNLNRALVGGQGSDSSYGQLAMQPVAAQLYNQNLQQNLGQERSDLGYLTQNQIGLAGQRQGLANALLGRELVPMQLQQQNLGWDASTLGAITGLNNANNFYGTQYTAPLGATIGDLAGQTASLGMQIGGIAMGGPGGAAIGSLGAAGGGQGPNMADPSATSWWMQGQSPTTTGTTPMNSWDANYMMGTSTPTSWTPSLMPTF